MKNSGKISRTLLIVFSMIGFLDSIYLAIEKLTSNQSMCLPGIGNCFSVNNSSYSEIYGIPISILGAGAYLVLLLLFWLENRGSISSSNTLYMMFGITLIGVMYSAYLTYIEVSVLKAICPFCIISAISMVILFCDTTTHLVKTTV